MEFKNKNRERFFINSLLVVFSIATIISGFVLQIGFHIGNEGRHPVQIEQSEQIEHVHRIDFTDTVGGMDYLMWTVLHKVIIVVLLLLMIYHFVSHWKWYKGIIFNHLLAKKKVAGDSISSLYTCGPHRINSLGYKYIQ